MNPPISGQNTGETYTTRPPAHKPGRSCVQRDLLVGRRERPRDLLPALLAKHEPQLARWPQALWVSRAERCAWSLVGDRAQKILTKEARLTARLRRRFRHTIAHT
jgi:hypothetical protein